MRKIEKRIHRKKKKAYSAEDKIHGSSKNTQ